MTENEDTGLSDGLSNNMKGLLLPKTTIYDIMKKSLPPGAKTALNARNCMQSCVTEFIMFVTGEYVLLKFIYA